MAGSGDAGKREEEIRKRAYAIWLNEGQGDGRDLEYWREAEMQIEKETSAPSNSERPGKPKRGDGLTEV
jgi:hypothetical protein